MAEEPFTITMMQELFSDQTPDMSNEWYTYIRDHLGVTLDVNFVPTQSYVDKITTTIASGALPMVIAANSSVLKNQGILDMIDDGKFWDLTEIVKDFPNLYSFVGENAGLPQPLKASTGASRVCVSCPGMVLSSVRTGSPWADRMFWTSSPLPGIPIRNKQSSITDQAGQSSVPACFQK